jgi:hypothetical protein
LSDGLRGTGHVNSNVINRLTAVIKDDEREYARAAYSDIGQLGYHMTPFSVYSPKIPTRYLRWAR